MKLAWRHVSATGLVSTSRGAWHPTRTTREPGQLPLETAEVISGTAELSSGATLSATSTVLHPATADLSSAASLSATATLTHPATASLSSAAALSATATVAHPATTVYGTADLSASATLTATASFVRAATMSLSSASTLAATGTVIHPAIATLASSASLAAPAEIIQGPFQGMGLAEWHATIRSLLYYEFAVPLGAYISFENVEPSQPDGLLWMSADILDGPVQLVELGSPKRLRVSGRVRVSIHAPLGTGVRDSMRMVDALASAIRAASDFGVRFGVPSARTVGRSGRHWLVIVDVPYRVDEIA